MKLPFIVLAQAAHLFIKCFYIFVVFLLQFPPSFAAGDVGSSELDLKLSNSVFNTLKQHSYREERQSARLHEKKEHSTHVSQLFSTVHSTLYFRLA